MKTNRNFETKLELENLYFREAREDPFDIYGLYNVYEEELYRRIPEDVAEKTSPTVLSLATNTAGGRVRFKSDSSYVAIYAEMPYISDMYHFSRSGSAGFDLYVKEGSKYKFYSNFAFGSKADVIESHISFGFKAQREIMIHFPTYSNVKNLYIGLEKDASLEAGEKYRYKNPVVYYGSSITQGACACRPGNAYESIISIDHDCDFVNLGFSGSAKAETAITDYIAGLEMSVFVMDYDHNAPDSNYLESTHRPFFEKIRKSHPHVPVIFITRPNLRSEHNKNTGEIRNREIIFSTYMNALKNGDKNVYFIDGESLFEGNHRDLCTVDGTHPNDAGFLRMADRIGDIVGICLKD